MELKKLFSKKDLISLTEIVHRSLFCAEENELRSLFSDLKQLIYFEHAVCIMARMKADGEVRNFDMINVSYPSEWISCCLTRQFYRLDPVIRENFAAFGVQYRADTYKKYPPPKAFITLAHDFKLVNGYVGGQESNRGRGGSLFSFAGPSIKRRRRNEVILEYVVPHLHLALARIFERPGDRMLGTLSYREIEVLNWVKHGKSNFDIGIILGVSENTVKYHVKSIMQKMNTRTRIQAVAVALEQRLIDIG